MGYRVGAEQTRTRAATFIDRHEKEHHPDTRRQSPSSRLAKKGTRKDIMRSKQSNGLSGGSRADKSVSCHFYWPPQGDAEAGLKAPPASPSSLSLAEWHAKTCWGRRALTWVWIGLEWCLYPGKRSVNTPESGGSWHQNDNKCFSFICRLCWSRNRPSPLRINLAFRLHLLFVILW